jgi:hypothetical protein
MVRLGRKVLSGLLGLRVLRVFRAILVQLGLRVLLARMVLTGIKVFRVFPAILGLLVLKDFRVKLVCRVKPA